MKCHDCQMSDQCSVCPQRVVHWERVAVCERCKLVVQENLAAVRDVCTKKIEAIQRLLDKKADSLRDISKKDEADLSDKEKEIFSILQHYYGLRLDVTPWLNGAVPSEDERTRLYQFLDAADRVVRLLEK